MSKLRAALAAVVALALLSGLFTLIFHREWVAPSPEAEKEDERTEAEVPVHVAKIGRATLHRYIDAYGSVAPDAARDGKPPASAKLATPVAGVLAKVLCSEGQRVELGAPLFQLDERVAAAEAQKAAAAALAPRRALDRLESEVLFAQREYERAKRLSEQQLASEKDLAEAELKWSSAKQDLDEAKARSTEADQTLKAARLQASLTSIKAPLAGTIVRVNVSPGEAVETTTVLAEIIDLERLVVAARIPATELHYLKIGQPVQLDAAPREHPADAATRAPEPGDGGAGAAAREDEAKEASVQGAVSFIGFDIDGATDTALVRASLPEASGLRPGQYVRIRVVVEERANCLAASEESVVADAEGRTVVAVVEGETATQRPVAAGIHEGGLVEVRGEGLVEGTIVVTKGAYGLPKETKVRVVEP